MIVIIRGIDEMKVGHGTGAECEQLAFDYLNKELKTEFTHIDEVRLYEEDPKGFLDTVDWPYASEDAIAVDFFDFNSSPWLEPS